VTDIVPLNSQTHRTLQVHAEAAARYGDDQRFVPVIVSEFSHGAVHYPILLSKDPETGQFYCGAMLGFDPGENLFLVEGGGHDAYRPLNLQRGPFYTAGEELAIDLDHPRVKAAGGERLFDDSGAPTKYLDSITQLMRDLRPGLERTRLFAETLVSLRLIAPLAIGVSFDDGTARDVEGLYTIDQETLRTLPDDIVVQLFRRGYLQLIYLMLGSLKHVPLLAQKKNRRLLT
jgi:hypothetical protein